METTNSTEFKYQPVTVIEWTSFFFPDVKYVGYIKSYWGKNGRILMSLGRTPEEAILLSRNKQSGAGPWRLKDYLNPDYVHVMPTKKEIDATQV